MAASFICETTNKKREVEMSDTDLMANRYGNVLVITDDRGTSRITHHRDGAISGVHANGGKIEGIWSIEDGALWETFSSPPESAALGRHGGRRPFSDKVVGDTWQHTMPNGRTMKFLLIKAE
jgi:hypothetical protein